MGAAVRAIAGVVLKKYKKTESILHIQKEAVVLF